MLYVQASQTPGIDSPHLTRGEREASSDYPLCEVTQFKAFLCKLFAFEFQAASPTRNDYDTIIVHKTFEYSIYFFI